MKSIVEVDKNFQSNTFDENGIRYYDISLPPFKIYGRYGNDGFYRLPNELASDISDNLAYLSTNTSGIRVRFKTDSSIIAIKTEQECCLMPHMALTGSAFFDIYEKNNDEYNFCGTFFDWKVNNLLNPQNGTTTFDGTIKFNTKKNRDLTINFPLYSGVTRVMIGLEPDSSLSEGDEYSYDVPIVFYGSSITQGGCASRPGNNYPAILSRKYDFDFVNLGFSGNAFGEKAMAEYISNLNMSAFVYDYDYNAPTVEHLGKTHKQMYDIIRKKNPILPIIIISRPRFKYTDDDIQRRKIIYNTYIKAKNNGDNVYFVDGTTFFNDFTGNSWSVDSTHPNDLGFMCMAQGINEVIKNIIIKNPL